MKKKAIYLSAAAAVLALAILGMHAGLFATVVVQEGDAGPFVFAYQPFARGELGTVGHPTSEFGAALERAGVSERNPLSVYFPDGAGETGFSVEGVSVQTLSSPSLHLRESGVNVREISNGRYMFAEFPWRNRLSFLIGYLKVEPSLAAYRQSHGYEKAAAMTLLEDGKIIYYQPIVHRPST